MVLLVTAKQTVYEGSSPINMARVVGYANARITQASLNELRYMVVDAADPGTPIIVSTVLTIATFVFDSLQTDAIWTLEGGFNFKHQLGAAAVPDGKKTYLAQYRLQDTALDFSFLEFELPTKEQYFD